MLLNIKSYSGGFKPWDESKGKGSTEDKRIEVLAFSHHQFVNLYLAKGTGESLGQFSQVELKVCLILFVNNNENSAQSYSCAASRWRTGAD